MEKKLELLAPAGDLEKLKVAVDYGADAVYCGGEAFGLRAGAKNFSPEQLDTTATVLDAFIAALEQEEDMTQ